MSILKMLTIRIWLDIIRTIISTYLCRIPDRTRMIKKYLHYHASSVDFVGKSDIDLIVSNTSLNSSVSTFYTDHVAEKGEAADTVHLLICNIFRGLCSVIGSLDTFMSKLDSTYNIVDTFHISTPQHIQDELAKLSQIKSTGPSLICYIHTHELAHVILGQINIIVIHVTALIKHIDIILNNRIEMNSREFPIFKNIYNAMLDRTLSLDDVQNFLHQFRQITFDEEMDHFAIQLACTYELCINLKMAQQFIFCKTTLDR